MRDGGSEVAQSVYPGNVGQLRMGFLQCLRLLFSAGAYRVQSFKSDRAFASSLQAAEALLHLGIRSEELK